VDELIAVDGDADVRRVSSARGEEQQIAGGDLVGLYARADLELILHLARQADAVLTEDILRKAATVEAVRIGAAVAVRRAAQGERGGGQRIPIHASGVRCGRRRIAGRRRLDRSGAWSRKWPGRGARRGAGAGECGQGRGGQRTVEPSGAIAHAQDLLLQAANHRFSRRLRPTLS
jgi:hypothetical protein